MNNSSNTRQSPRVVLRSAISAQFDDTPVLVLELGPDGAKFEHGQRLAVGRCGTLACGPVVTQVEVRHSTLLPADGGFVHHTGVSFLGIDRATRQLVLGLLIDEARQQVREWDANLDGMTWSPQLPRSSAAVPRFIALRLDPEGWRQTTSTDPNQPLDGITVVDSTPKDEILMLCRTYQNGDAATRELLRRIAMLAVLEAAKISRTASHPAA